MADENKPTRKRTYLDVPFLQREQAQALGALSDRRSKRLFVPAGTDLEPFARWMPKQDPQAAPPAKAARRQDDAPRVAEPPALLGSEADFEREAVRISSLMGQSLDEAREFVRDRVRSVEETAGLAARDQFLKEGRAFDAVEGIREAVRQARHQFFAQRQHLYAPGTPGENEQQDPAKDTQRNDDDAALGRRYREVIQSIAASATLRGDEVNRTLLLDQKLETIHRDAWRKSGNAADGDRAIGELIRTRTGFAAEELPPQAAEALNKLRAERWEPTQAAERQPVADAQNPAPSDDAQFNPQSSDPTSIAPTHQHRHVEPDPEASAVTFADVADAFDAEEAKRAAQKQDNVDGGNTLAADDLPSMEPAQPQAKADGDEPAVQADADGTFADVGEARVIDDAMRSRGLTEDAAPGVSRNVDESTVKAGAANERVAEPGRAANDPSDTPVLDGSPGPSVRHDGRPAQNEGDAKHAANEQTRGRSNPVSEEDLKRLNKVRENERKAAEALLREQGKPMPGADEKKRETGDAGDTGHADENQIGVDPASRKPIVKRDGYEVPPQVASRYMVKEGRFWKLDGKDAKPDATPAIRPHFEDVGARLRTQQSDRSTIADMLAIAEAKNWDAIVVRGDEKFRRNAWIEASLSGVDMSRFKGFKPKESDEALLAIAKRERAALTINAGKSPEPSDDQKPDEKLDPKTGPKSGEAQADGARPAKPEASGAMSGVLLEHGSARYQHKPDASRSYFVRYRNEAGDEQTVWGVDLRRAIAESGAKAGVVISLKNLGETPVTVDEPVRDANGKVIGQETKETIRNTWEVKRSVSAQPEPVAASPERGGLTVAEMREQLAATIEKLPARMRTEVLNRFDARIQAGTEIEARISRGEISRDAGAAEIDKRAVELHAAWTAPKAAPKASPANAPQAEPQQARGPMPNMM